MSNDTVMIRLQKDTYGRDFNLESGKTQIITLPCHVFERPWPVEAQGAQKLDPLRFRQGQRMGRGTYNQTHDSTSSIQRPMDKMVFLFNQHFQENFPEWNVIFSRFKDLQNEFVSENRIKCKAAFDYIDIQIFKCDVKYQAGDFLHDKAVNTMI